MDEEKRKECLNRARGKRDYLQLLKKQLERELVNVEESVRIWLKRIN